MTRTRTIALAAVTLAVAATPAFAHVSLVSTSPGKGKTARTSIRKVSATFSGPIRSGSLKVVGPSNRVVSRGSGGRDPRKVSRVVVALKSGLKGGKYTARWSIVAADGHKEQGSWTFRLKR